MGEFSNKNGQVIAPSSDIEVGKDTPLTLPSAPDNNQDQSQKDSLSFPKLDPNVKLNTKSEKLLEELAISLGNAKFDRGFNMTLGQATHDNNNYSSRLQVANQQISDLELKIKFELIKSNTAPEERKAQFDKVQKFAATREHEGLNQFQAAKTEYQRRTVQEAEKARREGGASYALGEVLTKATKSASSLIPTTKESVEILSSAIFSGGEGIEKVRLKNLSQRGESVLGTTEEFAKGSNSSFSNAVALIGVGLAPLEKVSGMTLNPALESVDIGLRASRVASYNTFSGKDAQINYSDYKELEDREGLLKAAKLTMDGAKIALGAAALGPSSLSQLSQPMLVSGGMGYAGALSDELLSKEGFKLGRFLEHGFTGTADSFLFMGGITGIGHIAEKTGALHKMSSVKTFLSLENGVQKEKKLEAIHKSFKGLEITNDEARFVSNLVGEMKMGLSGKIDLIDSLPDVQKSLNIFLEKVGDLSALEIYEKLKKDPEYRRMLAGAVLKVGVSGFDAFDVKSGTKGMESLEQTGRMEDGKELGKFVSSKSGNLESNGDLDFRKNGESISITNRGEVPIEVLAVNGNEYKGYFTHTRDFFYLLDREDLSLAYGDILTSRQEVDPNGTEHVESFVDKNTKLIFSYKQNKENLLQEKKWRSSLLAHENENRSDILAGRAVDERRSFETQFRFLDKNIDQVTLNKRINGILESSYLGAEGLSLAASKKDNIESTINFPELEYILINLQDLVKEDNFEEGAIEKLDDLITPGSSKLVAQGILTLIRNSSNQLSIKILDNLELICAYLISCDNNQISRPISGIIVYEILPTLCQDTNVSPYIRLKAKTIQERLVCESYSSSFDPRSVNNEIGGKAIYEDSPFFPERVTLKDIARIRKLAKDTIFICREDGTPVAFSYSYENINSGDPNLLQPRLLKSLRDELKQIEQGELSNHILPWVAMDLYRHEVLSGFSEDSIEEFMNRIMPSSIPKEMITELEKELFYKNIYLHRSIYSKLVMILEELEDSKKVLTDESNEAPLDSQSNTQGSIVNPYYFDPSKYNERENLKALYFNEMDNEKLKLVRREFANIFHEENFNDDPLYDLLSLNEVYIYSDDMYNARNIWGNYLRNGQESSLSKFRAALRERLDHLISLTNQTRSTFNILMDLEQERSEVFPFKTEHIENLYSLFQEVHQGPLRSHIEAEFDIDLSEITFRSQLYFLQFLQTRDTEGFIAFKNALNKYPNQKYKIIEAFVANAEKATYAKYLIALPNNLPETIVSKILDKYLEIIESAQGLEEPQIQKAIRSANHFLHAYSIKARSSDNPEKVILNLNKLHHEILALGVLIRDLRRTGAISNITDLQGLQFSSTCSKDITDDIRNEIAELYRSNWESDASYSTEHREKVLAAHDRAMKNPDTKIYSFETSSEVLAFIRVDYLPDGTIHMGGLNQRPELDLSSIGITLLEEVIKLENLTSDIFIEVTKKKTELIVQYEKLGFVIEADKVIINWEGTGADLVVMRLPRGSIIK